MGRAWRGSVDGDVTLPNQGQSEKACKRKFLICAKLLKLKGTTEAGPTQQTSVWCGFSVGRRRVTMLKFERVRQKRRGLIKCKTDMKAEPMVLRNLGEGHSEVICPASLVEAFLSPHPIAEYPKLLVVSVENSGGTTFDWLATVGCER